MAALAKVDSITELLLQRRADPDTKDKNQDTPLHCAYMVEDTGVKSTVELLIRNNANPNIEDKVIFRCVVTAVVELLCRCTKMFSSGR